MPSRRRILSALAPAALALLALAGCGGDDAPTSASAARQTVTRTVTVPAATSTASTPATPAAPSDPDAPLTLQAAEQVLDARGHAPLGERDWRPDRQLKVLLGVSRSADPRAEQAFFFVGDTFIGTDTKDPSAAIEVVAQSDDSVTLGYGLYRPADQIDVPTGGTAEVTYRWDGTRLVPQGPIPASSPAAPLSRR